MYLYETHLHTAPVSRCGRAGVEETLSFYKRIGYAGVFITNHFIDGNLNIDRSLPYETRIHFCFSDYEKGVTIGQRIRLSVFCGVEISDQGTDFLIYGLDKQWYLEHPEIEFMKKSTLLTLFRKSGALIIHAHPFREAHYIDHIRLFPRVVHGVEVYNANRSDSENEMARRYAEHYGLPIFAGSDNHIGEKQRLLGGLESEIPIQNVADFMIRLKNGWMKPFARENTLMSMKGGSKRE